MENFQYSVQLSDRDWAEFAATADECGLLQADLASGDEPLSSDIDQGDSSGGSPPGPPPLLTRQPVLTGRGLWCPEEEEGTGTRLLVSRCEPLLAPGAGQQTPVTSAQSGGRQAPSSSAGPPSPTTYQGSAGDDMQRLLQGPASRGPVPRPPENPPGEPLQSPGMPQKPPSSPGALKRSPSRKKKRTAGTKGGGHPAGPDSPPPSKARTPALAAETGLGTRQEADPGTPTPAPRRGTGRGRTTPKAEQCLTCTPDSESPPNGALSASDSQLPPDGDLSTLDSESLPDGPSSPPDSEPPAHRAPSAQDSKSTLDSESLPDGVLSVPDFEPPAPRAPSTQDSELPPDGVLSVPNSEPPPAATASSPESQPPPTGAPSAPVSCSPLLSRVGHDEGLLTLVPEVNQQVHPTTPHSALPRPDPQDKAAIDMCTPVPSATTAAPSWTSIPEALPGMGESGPGAGLDVSLAVSPRGPESSADGPGHFSGEHPPGPPQTPKKKRVRFSMASLEEPEPGEALGPPSPARVAPGARAAPGAWDAVAVRPRLPQPRILKHLPPPTPSTLGGPRSGSFALTLPEAYEFLFCDTIEEEEEEDEEGAMGQVPGDMQWPDVCEFFFRDSGAQRPRSHEGCTLAPSQPAEPVPAPPPGDPVPISLPEAYEHFFGEEDIERVVELAPPPGPPGATTQELSLALSLAGRRAGEPRGPSPVFTFSQRDMCLVFVAFATWAVRTSDLHTPDAWKTVLLANLGTISAIRYFRRQAARGRPSPSPSPSPSRSPSP
ncbi:PGC-1 and ERR-induced regulator in muscle protein 1 [Tenrec ecaudatus]|uniref:PGC-1 and ERR-induced regulator in muscle protein 1 n=1 Tax=Tenrec ecaudatus TaxID=94439 RepID=UPI003F59BB47